jgi:hypothetical protein
MRQRWYDATIKRFIATDPLSSRRDYTYANCSPQRFTDPSGLDVWVGLTTSASALINPAGNISGGASLAFITAQNENTGEACVIARICHAEGVGTSGGVAASPFYDPSGPSSGWDYSGRRFQFVTASAAMIPVQVQYSLSSGQFNAGARIISRDIQGVLNTLLQSQGQAGIGANLGYSIALNSCLYKTITCTKCLPNLVRTVHQWLDDVVRDMDRVVDGALLDVVRYMIWGARGYP